MHSLLHGSRAAAVREVKLLRLLRSHPNVLGLDDLMVDDRGGMKVDLYIVSQLMETDLERVISSKIPITGQHIELLFVQLISGLAHMHEQGIVHRDIKPANCLVNNDCRLRIADLGMARAVLAPDDLEQAEMTEYVVSRWYRAPEVLLGSRRYPPAADMWSAGCVLAELMGRTPLLPGKSEDHQLDVILCVLGSPSEDAIRSLLQLPLPDASRLKLRNLPETHALCFGEIYPHAEASCSVVLPLLRAILHWDPSARWTATAAMAHPGLADALRVCDAQRDNGLKLPSGEAAREMQHFERSRRDLQAALWAEVRRFRPIPELRSSPISQQAMGGNHIAPTPPFWSAMSVAANASNPSLVNQTGTAVAPVGRQPWGRGRPRPEDLAVGAPVRPVVTQARSRDPLVVAAPLPPLAATAGCCAQDHPDDTSRKPIHAASQGKASGLPLQQEVMPRYPPPTDDVAPASSQRTPPYRSTSRSPTIPRKAREAHHRSRVAEPSSESYGKRGKARSRSEPLKCLGTGKSTVLGSPPSVMSRALQ